MTSPETLELEAVDAALAGRYVAPEHAELAELALLLRDDRPEPTPAWATHLDRRVEARFPSRPRERKFRVWLRNVSPALGLAACVVLVIARGVGQPGRRRQRRGRVVGGSSGSIATEEAPSTDASGGAEADAPVLRDSARARRRRPELRPAPGPRRAALGLAHPGGAAARDRPAWPRASATSRPTSAASCSRRRSPANEGGSLDLRVPSDRMEQAIQRISRLGRVRELQRRSVDITANVVSARERLSDARAERKSLLEQLANAVTVNETESIRARLEIVSREIARARRSLSRVNNEANFANVSVALVPRAGGDDDAGAWTPGDAFDDAMRVLEVGAGVLVIASAVLLPFALVWLLAWLGRRAVVRRRRERALDMA